MRALSYHTACASTIIFMPFASARYCPNARLNEISDGENLVVLGNAASSPGRMVLTIHTTCLLHKIWLLLGGLREAGTAAVDVFRSNSSRIGCFINSRLVWFIVRRPDLKADLDS